MANRNRIVLVLLLAIAPLLSGCLYSREIGRVKRALEKEAPEVSIQRQMTFSVGPLSIDFARWIVGMVDDEEAERVHEYLSDVRRVKMSLYNVRGMDGQDEVQISIALGNVLRREGWDLVARTTEDDESVWLYYKEKGDIVSDLYVVGLVERELFMVRFHGDLNDIVARAVEDADVIPELVGLKRRPDSSDSSYTSP